ncbi:hypothetical protein JMY81_04880 [Brenneria goodwinii]|uniref:Pilus assembly protein n=1 Tax=Brenneria goodwinii TaxID=1109412 RepID=A0A0G4JWU6_9GAMM|nr:hypothetical protein [Brenneria goodwinii]MCG8157094.1 hypothetical protein [Brenneria goodwinii]MCG8160166.1 hypothetical protein [Brenneria goodwinii]MCG8164689.1 hypothetical protein [Brenneria goodwinii]MCG8170605.1 hypothetical protein [Brenneria goodwinii]MCG8174133.1 hypothetical protein [Brenneria goodwinii]
MNIFSRFLPHCIQNRLQRFGRDCRGAVALEAVLIIPIGVFVIIASWELYQYFRTAAVVDRTAFLVANSLSMQRELLGGTDCTLANSVCTYNTIASDLMTPLDYKSNGGIVISLYAVETDDEGDNPAWKTKPEWPSRIYRGSENTRNVASLLTPPAGFPAPAVNDTVIAVEIFYDYTPFAISSAFWQALGGEKQIVSTVFYRPRFSALRDLK